MHFYAHLDTQNIGYLVQKYPPPPQQSPSLPQVALVFPNNDPVAFMVAFYGCLLAEVVPVPIEVPLSRKVPREILQLVCLFTLKW